MPLDSATVQRAMTQLRLCGSVAAPGYDKPEGVVVFHKASNGLFKATLDADDRGKEFGA